VLVLATCLACGLALAQMATYTDGEAGFSVDYPEPWEVLPFDEDGAVEFSERDAFFFVSVFDADLLPVTNLEELAALLLEDLDDVFDELALRSREATVLAGLPAVAVEYEAYDDFLEMLVRGVVIVAYDERRIVVVDMEAPSAEWERYAATFEMMQTSLVLLP